MRPSEYDDLQVSSFAGPSEHLSCGNQGSESNFDATEQFRAQSASAVSSRHGSSSECRVYDGWACLHVPRSMDGLWVSDADGCRWLSVEHRAEVFGYGVSLIGPEIEDRHVALLGFWAVGF